MNIRELVSQAIIARSSSYSPYSGFRVGAALITSGGNIYRGCNIESAAFSPSCCAERVAFYNAISHGDTEFEAIAIVGAKQEIRDFCLPCGVCRQVMAEFCNPDFKIISAISECEYKEYTLEQLLPFSFGADSVK